MGEFLRTTGGEFGVNTGRPRRCGWYDAVLARQAVRINGFTDSVHHQAGRSDRPG